MIRTPFAMIPLIAAILAATTTLAAGPDWDEPGDAGPLPSSAQLIFGAGPLSSISGKLGVISLVSDDDDDAQDMFWITISNPVRIRFAAGTSSIFGGFADFDTQLWLFDSDGFGLLANDDAGNPQSGFFGASDDGTSIVLTQPGTYLIAVSGAGSEPVDANDDPIFLFTTLGEVSGPDGPGGGNPIAGWSDKGDVGEYLIQLEGTEFLTPGDLDGSGAIDGADLALMLAAWGACPPDQSCPADLDNDGDVDAGDLGVLLGNWG